MDDRESRDTLEAFIRKEAAISDRHPITDSTSIADDLGQTGDDADILMERFFDRFGVDRGDYDFGRYFLMEGEGLLYHVLRKYLLGKPHTFQRHALTVGMLRKSVSLGTWHSETIES
ncbi:DUF1493 family protein [Burkholderia sp. IMCC1007]|uniref:DUF1493 family protein n=1 Tax=Burkholderia sp. IMCC1007 TaxID=3004104 RepID=UPI0022B36041|nr:DUF1493 family protein [Burkholderia sp. IMCC1007]